MLVNTRDYTPSTAFTDLTTQLDQILGTVPDRPLGATPDVISAPSVDIPRDGTTSGFSARPHVHAGTRASLTDVGAQQGLPQPS